MLRVKLFLVISEFVVVPSNTVVMAGEKMHMNCLMTNDSVVRKWSFYNSTRAIPSFLKSGSSGGFHVNFRHFGVDINMNGPVTISANYTRSSDAGIYTCHCEIDGKDAEYSAHLIVLGKNNYFVAQYNQITMNISFCYWCCNYFLVLEVRRLHQGLEH